jgi:DNA ligase (NAD+)
MNTNEIIVPPTNCPECNSMLIETGEYIQCPNVLECPAQVKGRIKNWIKELNLLEWGDGLVDRLVDSGKVVTIADLYKLTVADIASLDRMGDKSAQKCYDILWSYTTLPLDIFLGALSIQMIGGSTIRAIMEEGCDTLEKFGQLNAIEFAKVPGVGPTKAKFLADGLIQNQKLILELLDLGISIKDKIVGKLSGNSFIFTGAMVNKRPVLEQMVIDAGGTVKSSVGKGLSYLVTADVNSTSGKSAKAAKLGTKLITEDEFLEMLK